MFFKVVIAYLQGSVVPRFHWYENVLEYLLKVLIPRPCDLEVRTE